jgi:hypothetical protein
MKWLHIYKRANEIKIKYCKQITNFDEGGGGTGKDARLKKKLFGRKRMHIIEKYSNDDK